MTELAAVLAHHQPEEIDRNAGEAAERDQPVHGGRQKVHRGGGPGVQGHAEPEHEQIAEPEGEPREKADLGDVDGVEAEIRIDPKSYRAAGEDGGADIVADRVAGETRERCDAVRHVSLAYSPQCEEVIEGQGAERADHTQRGELDVVRRYFGQRGQDHAGIDTPEGADQGRDRKSDDEETRRDSEPFPADPFLEATPKRGQQSVHSSSRRGGNEALPTRLMGWRWPIAPHVKDP